MPMQVLCAWGDIGAGARANHVLEMIRAKQRPFAIRLSKAGNPVHPLRQRLDGPLIPIRDRDDGRSKEIVFHRAASPEATMTLCGLPRAVAIVTEPANCAVCRKLTTNSPPASA
jgi:hypothetical protein